MKLFLTLLLVIGTAITFGQIPEPPAPADSQQEGQETSSTLDVEEIERVLDKKKVQLNLEFGTSFGTGGYGSYFGTYVAPSVTYPVAKRFSLSVGGYFAGVSPMMHSDGQASGYHPFHSMVSRSFLFVKGNYRLTDNLVVSGTVYKEMNLFNNQQIPVPGMNTDVKGVIMGVDYKVNDHVFIRGEIEVSNGNSPYHRSPFMGSPFNRMHDPFFHTQ